MWRPSLPLQSLPMGPVLWLAAVGLLQVHVVDHPPCRDFVISANCGGGTFHLQVGAGDGLAIWVVVIGFDFPTLWATAKKPQTLALQFLLQLCSLELVGSVGLGCPGEYFYPVWRWIITENFCIHKCHQRFHSFRKIPHTLCQLAWLTWHWWSGLLCPMMQCLGICQGLLWLYYTVVMAAKMHVIEGQECISVNAVGGGCHWIVVFNVWGVALAFSIIK